MKPNLFNSVQLVKPKKNVFDLSHDFKFSGDMGNLIPILVNECVPGDNYTISCEAMVRFAPMLAPIMHRVDVSMHYFFVPNRILWDNWQDFVVNASVTAPVYPHINTRVDYPYYTAQVQKFMDYMGVPPNPTTNTTPINALPFAAYQCVYNEYYRDQNLVPTVDYKLIDGDNTANAVALLSMRKRAWEHDYFTASLPFAQKGNAVDIPIGSIEGDAPIHLNSAVFTTSNEPLGLYGWATSGTSPMYPVTGFSTPTPGSAGHVFAKTDGLEIQPGTINDLRRAMRLQEWLEKNARGGTRYTENILMHFGVKSSDARLQRPEYITGIKSPIVISEVLNTTGQADGLPQGNMAGHGIGVTSGKYGKYFCEEHGYIIGVMSVMPKTAYQQGIPRTYLKKDTLDYFWPSFANIGEQEVQNQELYAYTSTAEDTWGYVPRYAEYKYMPSRVAGEFRTSLDYWHLGRKFATQPALNQTFIECDPAATKRIFAVEEGADSLYCHVYNKIKAVRPMPKFGTPML
jgi:hypothetical protein